VDAPAVAHLGHGPSSRWEATKWKPTLLTRSARPGHASQPKRRPERPDHPARSPSADRLGASWGSRTSSMGDLGIGRVEYQPCGRSATLAQ
jgi:hypothetical protein